MNVVYLKGANNYELGLCHGKKLRTEIHSLINDAQAVFRDSFLLFRIIPPKTLAFVIGYLVSLKYPRRYRQEMRGISDGSGVKIYWIFFFNSFFDIGHILTTLGLTDVNWGCSGFLTNDTNGKLVLAKTFDLAPATLLVKYRTYFCLECGWLKHKYYCFSFPGIIAGDYYINSNNVAAFFFHGGLTMNLLGFFNRQPAICFLREFYEHATTYDYDKAKNYLVTKTNPFAPFRGFLCDGSSGSLFEVLGSYKSFESYSGTPLLSTNHFTSVKTSTKRRYYLDSTARYNNLSKLVTSNMSLNDVQKVLAYKDDALEGPIASSLTIFAMIYVLGAKEAYFTPDAVAPVTENRRFDKLELEWNYPN